MFQKRKATKPFKFTDDVIESTPISDIEELTESTPVDSRQVNILLESAESATGYDVWIEE